MRVALRNPCGFLVATATISALRTPGHPTRFCSNTSSLVRQKIRSEQRFKMARTWKVFFEPEWAHLYIVPMFARQEARTRTPSDV